MAPPCNGHANAMYLKAKQRSDVLWTTLNGGTLAMTAVGLVVCFPATRIVPMARNASAMVVNPHAFKHHFDLRVRHSAHGSLPLFLPFSLPLCHG